MANPTRWTTRILDGQPRDIKIDAGTNEAIAVANWTAPLEPLRPNRCANCGGARQLPEGVTISGGGVRLSSPLCTRCGMSADEDLRHHQDIVQRLGETTFGEAAERASRTGRHVLALKVATAGAYYGEDRDRSRVQRIRELERVGASDIAQQDVRAWLESSRPMAPVCLRIVDAQVKARQHPSALNTLNEGLRRSPTDRQLLLRRAQLHHELNDEPHAIADALRCLGADDELSREGMDIVLLYAIALLDDHRASEAAELINRGAPFAHRYARATFALARAEHKRGQTSDARRWLRQTLDLDHSAGEAIELLRSIEREMGIASTV